jgi:hypothetical protein
VSGGGRQRSGGVRTGETEGGGGLGGGLRVGWLLGRPREKEYGLSPRGIV